LVRALLAAKAEVNAKTNSGPVSGATALMFASMLGNLEVVRALLAAKADVNIKCDNGVTALMEASVNGHQEVVQLLKNAGAGHH
jgi:serine/threonine-protein phosphatase 6 regulatory ankyrin repeat subunit B